MSSNLELPVDGDQFIYRPEADPAAEVPVVTDAASDIDEGDAAEAIEPTPNAGSEDQLPGDAADDAEAAHAADMAAETEETADAADNSTSADTEAETTGTTESGDTAEATEPSEAAASADAANANEAIDQTQDLPLNSKVATQGLFWWFTASGRKARADANRLRKQQQAEAAEEEGRLIAIHLARYTAANQHATYEHSVHYRAQERIGDREPDQSPAAYKQRLDEAMQAIRGEDQAAWETQQERQRLEAQRTADLRHVTELQEQARAMAGAVQAREQAYGAAVKTSIEADKLAREARTAIIAAEAALFEQNRKRIDAKTVMDKLAEERQRILNVQRRLQQEAAQLRAQYEPAQSDQA